MEITKFSSTVLACHKTGKSGSLRQKPHFTITKVIQGYLSWMVMRYSGLLGGFRLFGDSRGEVIRW